MRENFSFRQTETSEQSLHTDVRFLYDYNSEKQGEMTVRFGNSGLAIHTLNKPNASWDLHFTPEDNYSSAKGLREDGDTVKYSRMFAVGVLALLDFLKNLNLDSLEKDVSRFFTDVPLRTISLWTNQKMLTFTKKMLGDEYFTTTINPSEENNLTKVSIDLEKIIADSKENPKVLANLLKFADPEKVAAIRVKNK